MRGRSLSIALDWFLFLQRLLSLHQSDGVTHEWRLLVRWLLLDLLEVHITRLLLGWLLWRLLR